MTDQPTRSHARPARSVAERLDAADPLAGCRGRFLLPDGVIYLDGNSLGALPAGVPEAVADVVRRQWGQDLIRSWSGNGWWDAPIRIGAALAPLLGAGPDQVAVGDSTSVNLFKAMVAAARLRPDRRRLIVDASSFPTDLYIAGSVARMLGLTLDPVAPAEVPAALARDTADVAAVVLNHVDYRTGELLDAAALTAATHDAGAVSVWDLCHSAGILPIELDAWQVDLAVGCTYKYLNGGPGSPAFVYVNARHAAVVDQPLTGWHGHAAPFAMGTDYRPAPGITRTRVGTPPILSMLALEAALRAYDGVSIAQLRAKSLTLTGLALELAAPLAAHGIEVITPVEPDRRGGQVSLRHPAAAALTQALAERGVIGDFREPDVIRLGFHPLYLRHTDVHDALQLLGELLNRP